MKIDHEQGYARVSTSPIVPLGAAGEWDDYFVYGVAVIRDDDGLLHLFYSGTRNSGANPRLEGSVGHSTSSDGLTFSKQGKVIDKCDVPDLGLTPFSILRIDGVYHLFCAIFNNTGTTYNCCVLTSTDLVNWTWVGKMTGLDPSAHSPCVIEDPADASKLILYYTSMMAVPGARIHRATASKADPLTWSDDMPVTDFPSIYPSVRWTGERFEMFVAKPVESDVSSIEGYTIHKTASIKGLSFPDPNKWTPIIQRGALSAFDYRYTTTPFVFEDRVFYSGRPLDNLGYRGIGCAKLCPIGGIFGWDWTKAGVGPWSISKTGSFGIRLAAGSKGNPSAFSHGVGRDKAYEVWIYDDMTALAGFQNTFRVVDSALIGPVLGIWCGSSGAKYVYRLTGGTWASTGISRTLGWHKLTFDVGDDVVMKIDDIAVATDSAFDTAIDFDVGLFGATAGTGYADDFSVNDLP